MSLVRARGSLLMRKKGGLGEVWTLPIANCQLPIEGRTGMRVKQALHSRDMTDPIGHLKRLMRDIPDFPKPGIVFRDISPLLADPSGLALSVELMANPSRGKNLDLVVGAESRGFI